MASGPRHLRDSFVATGLRKTEQTLTATEKAQVQENLGLDPITPDTGWTAVSDPGDKTANLPAYTALPTYSGDDMMSNADVVALGEQVQLLTETVLALHTALAAGKRPNV
jgi:hypothetical protein